MHCTIIACGHKMPTECKELCIEYLTRLKRFMRCTLLEIPTLSKEEEGKKILQKISDTDFVVALDILGTQWSTIELSKNISQWQQMGKKLFFIIGGPDGLSETCLKRANERWSLSHLTFPHALVRILLLEQLYRGASILANHPYHRD